MKNVLIDMHRLKHNPYNGLYIFSKELGQCLADAQPEDMRLHFYVPEKDAGIFGPGVQYEKHRSVDKFFRFGTGKFDVWHVTTTLSWYKPFSKKVKVVYTIHDLNFLIEEKDNPRRNKRVLGEIRKRAHRADYIVGISQYALDVANEFLPIKDKPQRVIYNGASFLPEDQIQPPQNIPRHPFLFSIGQLYPRKNFHVLPPLLVNNDYELIIAGLHQTAYGEKILEAAKNFGVKDRVHLIGPVSEGEKHWYYKHCEAFLFPSFAEGFGLPVVEAMHYGKPVFLSTETCLPEIGGNAAYYFKNFNADIMREQFANGMRDYSETKKAEAVVQQSKKFSWHRAAEEYIEVYNTFA
ncbi:glycosyltransferase family 4 protein [Flavisolibacter ginsenosidimutans]|uniref:Glycosyltransferase family 4 protein n=1 Tax=Flavisolibacter ginsenosidimutans TaxID=661481 RepID=A0A5B8UNG0_9BACT|nr:glycosyltransferase family 1 protein [Flavisolibacter ginsenosidimutans]QEC58103.1 glycosyltransferase family 4 protein [Flavisolibacter ginsenosidimutans]